MRLMYDAVTLANVPSDATMVACYMNGIYENVAECAARFPHALRPTISVRAFVDSQHPSVDADVLDVETGDATPGQAPAWAADMRRKGRVPTVYCNESTLPVCKNYFAVAGVPEPMWGVAVYVTPPVPREPLPAGWLYHQYGGVLGKYDLNSVRDFWPGLDPTPSKGFDLMTMTAAQTEFIDALSDAIASKLLTTLEGRPDGSKVSIGSLVAADEYYEQQQAAAANTAAKAKSTPSVAKS